MLPRSVNLGFYDWEIPLLSGDKTLGSAWGSAGAIYWDAKGTVGHNLCLTFISSPPDNDELKCTLPVTTRRSTQPLIKGISVLLRDARRHQSCQPRYNFSLTSQNTHCSATCTCISNNHVLQIFYHGIKLYSFLTTRLRCSYSVYTWSFKMHYSLQQHQVTEHRPV